jgi:hypothetical protein
MKRGGVATPGGLPCRSHSKREMSCRSKRQTSPSRIRVAGGRQRRDRRDEVRETPRVVPAGAADEPDLILDLVGDHPPAAVLLLEDPALPVEGLGDERRLHQGDPREIREHHPLPSGRPRPSC